jgi:hypothetical protein
MRWLRRFPVRIRVSALLACVLALPLALAGCAGARLLPDTVGSIADGESGAAADGHIAGAAMALGRQVGAATAQLQVLLTAIPAACASPCLSPEQQDAIVARAVAEHEMRHP